MNFNSCDIWYELITRSINDRMPLAMSAAMRKSKNVRKSRSRDNRVRQDNHANRLLIRSIYCFENLEFERFDLRTIKQTSRVLFQDIHCFASLEFDLFELLVFRELWLIQRFKVDCYSSLIKHKIIVFKDTCERRVHRGTGSNTRILS